MLLELNTVRISTSCDDQYNTFTSSTIISSKKYKHASFNVIEPLVLTDNSITPFYLSNRTAEYPTSFSLEKRKPAQSLSCIPRTIGVPQILQSFKQRYFVIGIMS